MPVGKMVLFRWERRIFVVQVFLFVSSLPALRPPHRTGEAHLVGKNNSAFSAKFSGLTAEDVQ